MIKLRRSGAAEALLFHGCVAPRLTWSTGGHAKQDAGYGQGPGKVVFQQVTA